MASSDFTKQELVTKGNKTYPVVGGRLRLAHDEGLQIIETEPVSYEYGVEATVKATATIWTDVPSANTAHKVVEKVFSAHGTATKARDGARMEHTLLELAETRAVARALRYAGFGVEYTGAEEMSHVDGKNRSTAKSAPVPPTTNQRSMLRHLAARLKEATGGHVNVESPKTYPEAQKLIDQMTHELDALEEHEAHESVRAETAKDQGAK